MQHKGAGGIQQASARAQILGRGATCGFRAEQPLGSAPPAFSSAVALPGGRELAHQALAAADFTDPMPEVRAIKHNTITEWARQTPHLLFAVCAACLVAALIVAVAFVVRRPAPAVVETVTTGLDEGQTAKDSPLPVVNTPQLPARDEDVERAGDKIAEATVYLARRQKGAALRALTEAHAAARRAYERRSQQRDPSSHKLLAAIRELEQAQLAVERGSFPDARQKLLAINHQLDQVEQ
ncbi:MAG: hypothetical protein QOF61_164 [Acidobacteriota bacterium]|nr:hypothetical protein [Acidobacteriota bacterium]